MALYTIEHSCGHTEQTQVYGTDAHGERRRKIERMAAQPCSECTRKAALEEAESWEREIGLAGGMDGTEKQVAWARCIRRERCADIVSKTKPPHREGFVAFIAAKPAKYWIDEKPAGITVAKEYAKWVEDGGKNA